MLKALFTEHPASVDETYGEHMTVAATFSAWMLLASMACLVHAVFPFLFVKTGSSIIEKLNDRMVVNRRRHARETAIGEAAPGIAR